VELVSIGHITLDERSAKLTRVKLPLTRGGRRAKRIKITISLAGMNHWLGAFLCSAELATTALNPDLASIFSSMWN
jgi:hypothetical protein